MAAAVSAEEYKAKYEALVLEKSQMEMQFGQKRAQFRQLYLDVEEKLKAEKESSKQLEIQLRDLTKKNDDLRSEIEGVRIAAQLSNEEQLSSIKRGHQEEIASLQHIYQEHAKENQTRLAQQFEDERNKLVETVRMLESKLKDQADENKSANASAAQVQPHSSQTGLMSSISNAFGKKASHIGSTSKLNSPQQEAKDVSLDFSQQQVQKDVDAWKSVVSPLEKSAANEQELQELKKAIELERSARTDLEMYVAVLNTQKSVLQEDTDKLRRELHNVCRLYEQEKASLGELKQTWKLANEQFLDQQTKISFELEHTKQLLTPQQLEHVSKEMRQHRAQNPPPVSDRVSTKNDAVFDFDPLHKKGSKSTETLVQQAKKPSPMAAQKQDMATAEKPLVLSSSSDSDTDSDINEAIRSQNKKRYNVFIAEGKEEVEESTPPSQSTSREQDQPINRDEVGTPTEKKHLKKSNSSGDILSPNFSESSLHEKSLSHGDVSLHKTFVDEVDSNMSLNKTGWSTVPAEDYYSHACMMCQNYEKQLQRLQKELVAVQEKEKMLIDNVRKLQENVTAEKEKLVSLEKSIESTDVDTKSQITIYKNNQQEVDKQVQLLHSQFKRFQDDIVKEIKALSEERDRALAEAAQVQNSSGEISSEKEEDLKTEIMFLKDRMMAEQVDREAIEGVLQQDLKEARSEIAQLHKQINQLKKEPEEDEPLLTL